MANFLSAGYTILILIQNLNLLFYGTECLRINNTETGTTCISIFLK